MTPKRLSAKFFLDPSTSFDPADLVPVFHDWIGRQVVDEMLIDVADYRHVHNGPGVMLIALEADYVFDAAEGNPGIRYIRKRSMPESMASALAMSFAGAARACQLLEASTMLQTPIVFDSSTVEIEVLDKLNYPAGSAGVRSIEKTLMAVGQEVYGFGKLVVERVLIDERRPIRLLLKSGEGVSFADIVRRLRESYRLQSLLAEATG